jgi:alpha-galactosidase
LKIAMIGAGSVTFAGRLLGDILSYHELRDSAISLMDLRPERLELVRDYAQTLARQVGANPRIEVTQDRRRALADADYVILMVQIGGEDPFRHDIDIPRRYGVDQTVGDTLGPGGIFRGLRTIPMVLDMCRDIAEMCPDAWLLNYTNPMAIVCRAVTSTTRVKCVGLCHSVQRTSQELAEYCGLPPDEVRYWVAGINHMAWFLEFAHNGADATPLLRQAARNPAVRAKDPVRFEIFDYFQYFNTESSHHMSEYVPYFRRRPDILEQYLPERWDYPTLWNQGWDVRVGDIRRRLRDGEPLPVAHSREYGVDIIHSLECDVVRRVNVNVPNHDLITNLAPGCCVEVPCVVDGTGIHPCRVGDLPPQCAALNRTNINVQELAVAAGVTGDRAKVVQAVALDPLSSALLTLPEAKAMVDELLDAEADWLPQFRAGVGVA